MKTPYVYMLTNRRNGTLYTGMTTQLAQRVFQHKEGFNEGFTKKYGTHLLVWYEEHETIIDAIAREKTIKRWKRIWKLKLIEEFNPEWQDLSGDLY